jgi:hypothetical protein
MVGIQGEFQIEIDEWTWTLRQAPWEMTDNEERMPLHSHKGAEWGRWRGEREKRTRRNILTLELVYPQ